MGVPDDGRTPKCKCASMDAGHSCFCVIRRLTLVYYIADGPWDVEQAAADLPEKFRGREDLVLICRTEALCRLCAKALPTLQTHAGMLGKVCLSDPRRAPSSTAEAERRLVVSPTCQLLCAGLDSRPLHSCPRGGHTGAPCRSLRTTAEPISAASVLQVVFFSHTMFLTFTCSYTLLTIRQLDSYNDLRFHAVLPVSGTKPRFALSTWFMGC